ncbi:PREDICTED: adipogenesis regulatory factor [Gekko japonicus]|uniref:Adipogenesis regulatory factor n=1 Tax=Gekko japonicus TaxID=146911 RepID=A0ABM1L5B0_GEKJA|nr:PREDICTED: adipogenesis regulatory factor [Gekko japonicus]
MFKLNLAEEATKVGNTAQETANSASQAMQQTIDQATAAGQKALDDACKSAQDAGEKAVQNVTSQVNAWGKSFGLSEEKKDVPT